MLEPSNRALDLLSVSLNQKIHAVQAQVTQLSDKISRLQLKDERPPNMDGSFPSLDVWNSTSLQGDARQVPQQIKPQSRIQPLAEQEGIVRLQNSEDWLTKIVEERFIVWQETQRNLINAKFENMQAELTSRIAELKQENPVRIAALQHSISGRLSELEAKFAEEEAKSQETLRLVNAAVAQLQKDMIDLRAIKREAGIDQGGLSSMDASNVSASNSGTATHETSIEDHFDNEMCLFNYTPVEGVWDALLFLGIPSLGFAGSLLLGFLVCANILMQAVFCLVCLVAFAEMDFDESSIFGLHIWRWNSGHDASNVNNAWPVSLASRICQSDRSLPISGMQSELYDALLKYHRKEGFRFVGELGCTIALLCFWTSLWNEALNTSTFVRGVAQLYGLHTQLLTTKDGLKFVSIGRLRSGLLVMSAVMRSIVVSLLAFAGTVWLVQTTSVGDLLLNAVALELVLNVDELIFKAFAPLRVRALLGNLMPLPLRHLPHWRGADFHATIGTILISAAGPLAYVFLLKQTEDLVDAAEDALCNGITNFVYSIDPFGMVHVHDGMRTPADADFQEAGFDQTHPRILAVKEVIEGTHRDEWQYAIYEPDLTELRQKSTMGPEHLMNQINPKCVDFSIAENHKVRPFQNFLRHDTGDPIIGTCAHVEPYCYSHSGLLKRAGILARSLCPSTCGCASAINGTMLLKHPMEAACPTSCWGKVSDSMPTADTCEDQEVKGALSQTWKKQMQEMKELDLHEHSHVEALEREGCLALLGMSGLERSEFCTGEWGVKISGKPLMHRCLESCGCLMVPLTVSGCPGVCKQQEGGKK